MVIIIIIIIESHLFIHSFIYLFIHSFIYSFIYSFIHSFIYLLFCLLNNSLWFTSNEGLSICFYAKYCTELNTYLYRVEDMSARRCYGQTSLDVGSSNVERTVYDYDTRNITSTGERCCTMARWCSILALNRRNLLSVFVCCPLVDERGQA